MELRQLRFFLCAARFGNISKAAEDLHLAQPALSRQIRQLEEELGVVLFKRGVRGVELTPDGQRLVTMAAELVNRADALVGEFNPRETGGEQNISIGMPEGLALELFPAIADQYARAYPLGRLNLKIGMSDAIQKWIEDSTVDIGVVYDFVGEGDQRFCSELLIEDSLCVLAAPDYDTGPLPSDKETFQFRLLAEHPLVLGSPSNAVRRALDRVGIAAHVQLKPQIEVDNFSVLVEFVRQRRGITVFTGTGIAAEGGSDRFKTWKLSGPDIRIRISIVWLATRQFSRPLKRFTRMLREQHRASLAATRVKPGMSSPVFVRSRRAV